MKKLVTCYIILFAGMNVHAQCFYVRTGLGAAISTAPTSFYTDDYDIYGSLSDTKVIMKGYGTGIPVSVSIGYNFRKYFGFDLGFNYFNGIKVKSETIYPDLHLDNKTMAIMYSIVPALTFNILLKKVEPYARFGMIIGVKTQVKYEMHGELSSNYSHIDGKTEDYGGTPVGCQVALGTDVILNRFISFFLEARMDAITYSPEHGKLYEFKFNNEDHLWEFTTKEKKVNYVNSIDYNKEIPDDSPDQRLKFTVPLNNLALLIGIKFYLFKE
jgi:hypothetical protein